MTVSTTWTPEIKEKVKIKLKSEKYPLKTFNEGKDVTKNKIVPFTNISMFRTAGSITAGRVEKIGSTGGTCLELLATPSSRRRQIGTGWNGSITGEVERLEQAPDWNS